MKILKKAHAMIHQHLLGKLGGLEGAGIVTAYGLIMGMMLAFFALAFGLFIFWIMMVVDAFRRTNWPHPDQRTLWLIILISSLFLQIYWVAALVYYFAMKKPLDRGETPTFFENQRPASPTPTAASAESVDPIVHKTHKKSHKE